MEGVVTEAGFWRGKRVFVTGHTGFKGSWLCLWLQRAGARVHGYALDPESDPSMFRLAQVGEGMESTIADIRDLGTLREALRRSKAEVVFHLAAQSLVRRSYAEPVETYATNVMGTVNVLEAARACTDVRALLVVTSDKCYENREWVWGYRENEPMGGRDPYSSSKGCAELVTAAYRASFFERRPDAGTPAAIATARAGNVIGGGDWAADRLLPDMMRAAASGRPVRIRNPHAVRPWQHVLEPLAGYLALARELHANGSPFAEAWNFGPYERDCRAVQWIVERLAAQWGEGLRWEIDAGEHPHEAHFLKLDNAKAVERLGWRPRWDLETALRSIVAWHKAHASGADMRSVVLEQIGQYETSIEKGTA
jgi:CDP-glucose 4,6-dehydratase